MNKNCEPARVAELLAKLVTEEITKSEKSELARMIEQNNLNDRDTLERIIRQQVCVDADASQNEEQERILESLKAKIFGKNQWLRRRILRYVAAAASLIVVATGSYFIARNAARQPECNIRLLANEVILEYPSGKSVVMSDGADISQLIVEDSTVSATEGELFKIIVPRGVSQNISLEDGTRVFLFPGSELEFPAKFNKHGRNVRLTGEGYFEVNKDPARPFRVEANGASIEVLGTIFDVRAYQNEATVQTVLVSGRVKVNEIPVLPNQMAVFSLHDQRITVEDTDADIYRDRAHGAIIFDDKTLDEIMSSLSLWYDFKYDYTDNALKNKRFRVRLEQTPDFAKLIELLKLTGEVDFQISDKNILILPAKK